MRQAVLHIALTALVAVGANADSGKLLVVVQDAQKKPIKGIEVGIEGGGGSRVTGDDGKALLPLAPATKENDGVSIQILHSPPGKDYVLLSPFDGRLLVPSFLAKADNFVRVVVVQRGDLAALQNGTVLVALAEQINKATAPQSKSQAVAADLTAALEQVSSHYGLEPKELDEAIRSWGARTDDPYEAGLAALYERRYTEATPRLQESLAIRGEILQADQERLSEDQQKFSLAAFFLGNSLFAEGKFADAANAYMLALRFRPNDSMLLNAAGVSFDRAGNYKAAHALLQRSVSLRQASDTPDLATSMRDLGEVLEDEGDLSGAEQLYRKALDIEKRTLGPNSSNYATSLNDIAEVLSRMARYSEAEPLCREALRIRTRLFGAEHPYVAQSLNNLAGVLSGTGRYSEAEPLLDRAIKIWEKSLGPNHPEVAVGKNELGVLLAKMGKYSSAELLLRSALQINEAVLGPYHPEVAKLCDNLGVVLVKEDRLSEAEQFANRALSIRRKVLPPKHPEIAASLANVGTLMLEQGKYSPAETLLREALTINEEQQPQNPPDLASTLESLASVLFLTNRISGAELLLTRAVALREESLGPDDPTLGATYEKLARVSMLKGDLESAQRFCGKAQAILEKKLGPANIEVAVVLLEAADIETKRNNLSHAEQLYRSALSIARKTEAAPYVLYTMSEALGDVLRREGKESEALQVYKEDLELATKNFGPEDSRTKSIRSKLASRKRGE